MERAAQAGIGRVLAVGSDLASSRAAVACAERYAEVYAAVGVHPHEAHTFNRDAADVETLLDAPNVVAVGEIGIDRARPGAPLDLQMEVFKTQLRWAAERGLPVSVHNRDADAEVLAALQGLPVTAVLHCFSSGLETARRAWVDGHIVSFAGNVTFPRADALREVAAEAPLDRLLIETDAPVLAPQPWRGRRNEPAYLVAVRDRVSEVRGVDPAALSEAIWRTADQVFSWEAA
jgi:TatD DNase family protein